MAVTFADDFSVTGDLEGSSPDVDAAGGGWVEAGGNWSVDADGAHSTPATGYTAEAAVFGVADEPATYRITFRLPVVSAYAGLAWMWANGGNLVWAVPYNGGSLGSGSGIYVETWAGGSLTTQTYYAYDFGTSGTYVLEVEVDGTTVTTVLDHAVLGTTTVGAMTHPGQAAIIVGETTTRIRSVEVENTAASGGAVRLWDGSAWVEQALTRHDGTTWVAQSLDVL